ncbi:MAG: formyltetrahydrofolate deformylase [Candidatus Omnitrophica bacterium]|nr:formyltetrahydrofolate deformylase [Candidatus Omnitrophota bacterium]
MLNATILISCPDKKGITATVTNFVYNNNGNILHSDQHTDDEAKAFFMRIVWDMKGFTIKREMIGKKFSAIAGNFEMKWELYFSDQVPRVAVFVSKQTHCLYDLFLRLKSGQFRCEMPVVVSNHPYAEHIAREFGAKYYEFPITAKNKPAQEKKQLNILENERIDLIILARYHQILTRGFVDRYRMKIINIHHSFLPAFAGSDPYSRAFKKGVKIIGATSHYVTEKLDEGPIIEQDTARISHRDAVKDLIRSGEDLEKMVLARAVRWHLERKILVYDNKTVIFD